MIHTLNYILNSFYHGIAAEEVRSVVGNRFLFSAEVCRQLSLIFVSGESERYVRMARVSRNSDGSLTFSSVVPDSGAISVQLDIE